jgi:hypothetical protein
MPMCQLLLPSHLLCEGTLLLTLRAAPGCIWRWPPLRPLAIATTTTSRLPPAIFKPHLHLCRTHLRIVMSRPVGTIDGEKSREQELEAQLAHVEEQLALETRRSAEQAAAIRDLSQTVKMQSDIIEMIRAAPAPMEVDEVLRKCQRASTRPRSRSIRAHRRSCQMRCLRWRT